MRRMHHGADKLTHSVVCWLASISLVFSLAPAASVQAREHHWSDAIDTMVSSGDFIEGEVVVALWGSEEGVLQAQASLPGDAFEPLMEVGSAALSGEAADGMIAQAAEDVTLTLVRSDTLSTKELLQSLADDERVAFAEPNYLGYGTDDDPVAAVDDVLATEDSFGTSTSVIPDELDLEGVLPTLANEDEQPSGMADSEESQTPDPEVPEDSDETLPTLATEDERATLSEAAQQDAPDGLVLASQASGAYSDLTPLQWGMWDTATSGARGTKGVGAQGNYSINVPEFGSAQVGANMDEEVVVAVIDGGVDFDNPDLAARAYTFSPQLQEQLGCDVHGYNAAAENPGGKLTEKDSHGTHCAGVIGAAWDGRGVSGVGSNVRIVSIQNEGTVDGVASDLTSLGNALRAFSFVKRANQAGVGIKVTSNSWGMYQTSKSLDAALRDLGQTQGVVHVFGSGNEGKDLNRAEGLVATLANNPYVIIVDATDQTDVLASFSNYGDGIVHLAAPGNAILSTTDLADSRYIPDATLDTNILYESFEKETPFVTLQQVDKDGNLVSSAGTISTDARLSGTRSMVVPIDRAYQTGDFSGVPMYTVRMTFDIAEAQRQSGINVVASLKAAKDLYFGFGVGTSRQTQGKLDYIVTNMTGNAQISSKNGFVGSSGGSFEVASAQINADGVTLDFDNLKGKIVVNVSLVTDQTGADFLAFDSIGVGTQAVPYEYMDGTSMATPAVAGAMAVLSAQTGLEGAQLVSLTRSKVRVPNGGPLAVRSGGVFDFNVQGSVDSQEEDAPAPAPTISSIEVLGSNVTIKGSGFGSQPGSVDLTRYVVKDADDKHTQASGDSIAATVDLWSCSTVTCTLAAPFEGILKAVLTNTANQHDTAYQFVSKGSTVFEQDLPFDAGTGNPYEFDGTNAQNLGDWETKGPLVGIGCKLYYLPASQSVEQSGVYQRMLCFDLKTQTWSELPQLPEVLGGVSAVLHDGKLVVEGATTRALPSGEHTNEYPKGTAAEERVYVFDPAKGTWSKASAQGLRPGQTIFSDNGQLKVAGGTGVESEYGLPPILPVSPYDLASGLGKEEAALPVGYNNPQVVAKDGVIYLYDSYYASKKTGNKPLMRVKNGDANVLENALPPIAFAGTGEPGDQSETDPYEAHAVLAVASDGIVLFGLPTADGASDTLILRNGSNVFKPYAKRASEARVYSSAACTYRGKLYAIASTWLEPGQRIFRATAMDVPEYAGDLPCEEKDPDPTPIPSKTTPASTAKAAASRSTKLAKTGDEGLASAAFVALAGLTIVLCGLRKRRQA